MKENMFYGVRSLELEEMKTINGGDPFLRDLGSMFGRYWGALTNTVNYGIQVIGDALSSATYSNDWMMGVPPLTLYQ